MNLGYWRWGFWVRVAGWFIRLDIDPRTPLSQREHAVGVGIGWLQVRADYD